MSAVELPRINDPELIRVAAEPTSSTEYVVQVDVLDAVLPELLRALASDAVTHGLLTFTARLGRSLLDDPEGFDDPDACVRLYREARRTVAESLRQHGVGVLHLTPEAASSVGYDLDEAPELCTAGSCDLNSEADFAGMCRIHDADADDLPPRGE